MMALAKEIGDDGAVVENVMNRERDMVQRHWDTANARDWVSFSSLLTSDLLYEAPLSRERIRGRDGYVDFFRTWPGSWRAVLRQVIAEPGSAVSIIDFVAAPDEAMTGITIFHFSDGLIARVTDYWPDPYEPPARQSAHVERY